MNKQDLQNAAKVFIEEVNSVRQEDRAKVLMDLKNAEFEETLLEELEKQGVKDINVYLQALKFKPEEEKKAENNEEESDDDFEDLMSFDADDASVDAAESSQPAEASESEKLPEFKSSDENDSDDMVIFVDSDGNIN